MVLRPKTSAKTSNPSTKDEIAKLAYEFFMKRGCSHGHDMEDWIKAEKIVLSRSRR